MHIPVNLLGLSTAVPPHILPQSDVAAQAEVMFAHRYANFARMAPVFQTAGIEQRYSARPLPWFMEPQGWRERTAAYLEVGTALFVEAASRALAAAGLRADEVDTVVTISSTGIATPSLEARAAQAMGFRSDVHRVPVFGLGCAGGVSGVAIASRLAAASPGSTVLLVVIELCTLAFRYDELTKANIVATALFGDGAAACVFSTAGKGVAAVTGAGEHLWPDTLDIMGWEMDPQGFGVIFAQAIPGFAARNMRPAVDGILHGLGYDFAAIDGLICHPGGVKVINALEKCFALDTGALAAERTVLATHGNMSAPTVLFVLDAHLKAGLAPRSAMIAMGPGFTASCAVIEAV